MLGYFEVGGYCILSYFQSVGVSAIRGDGINEFFTLVDSAREEFTRYEFEKGFSLFINSCVFLGSIILSYKDLKMQRCD